MSELKPDLRPFGYAEGNYIGKCSECNEEFIADKRSRSCNRCAMSKYEAHKNTRATPSADTLAGLVRYGQVMTRIMKVELGEYVLYSEAAAMIERLQIDASKHAHDAETVRRERDALITELAQIKDQEPVGWLHIHQDFNTEFSKQRLTGGDFDRGFREEAVYASPVSDSLKAENERLREALMPFAATAELDIGEDEADEDYFKIMQKYNYAKRLTVGDMRKTLSALKGDSNDKG